MPIKRLVGIISLLLLFQLHAGTTGKIMGRVIDAKTKEPLPAANVIIEGTNMGAATDVDGYFVILNVPPGTYTLKVTYLGYKEKIIEGVRVNIDRTTEVQVELLPAIIKTKEVVVKAKRPIIKKDVTASVNIISSEELSNIPAVTNVQQVVAQQAGVILGRGGELHIRGGRQDEVVYIIDGVEVKDPYGGATFGAVPLISLQETEISKGGFDVDQGSAASGAISIVTKEGRDKYSLEISSVTRDFSFLGDKVYSFLDQNIGDPYLDFLTGKNLDLTSKTDRHRDQYKRVEFAFSGPFLPSNRKGAKFFVSGDLTFDKGRFPVSNDPDWYNKSYTFQWKFTFPWKNLKFFYSGFHRVRHNGGGYDANWRLALDHQTYYDEKLWQNVIGVNYLISPRSYLELRIGMFSDYFLYNDKEDVDGDGVDDFADRDKDGFVEIDRTYFEDSLGNFRTDILDSLYPGWEDHGSYIEVPYYWWEERVQSLYPSISSGPDWWSNDSTGQYAPRNRFGWGSRVRVDIYVYVLDNGDTVAMVNNRFYEFPLTDLPNLVPYVPPDSTWNTDSIFNHIRETLVFVGNQYMPYNFVWDRSQWYEGQSKTFSVSLRYTSQVTRHHEILAGLEFKRNDIVRVGADYASGGNVYLTLTNPWFTVRNMFPQDTAYNFLKWFEDHKINPWTFAFYLRDKIEIEGMVAKVGFRFDYFNPDGWVISDSNDPFMPDPEWGYLGIRVIKDPAKASPKWYFSPRIGVSHPISDRDLLHFTYGHYFQIPAFRTMIRDFAFSGAFPIIGNSNIDPEKIVSYEFGVKHAFTDNFAIDVTAYYKDIRDWIRIKQFSYGISGNYSTYVNEDYGSSRGIELQINKRLGGRFLPDIGFNMSYTFQVARGSFSSPRNAYDWMWRGYPLPTHESPLDWDERHHVTATLMYAVRDKGILGGRLKNFGIILSYLYGSGFPYTPPIRSERDAVEKINSEKLPPYSRTDLRIYKDFSFKLLKGRIYLDVTNLFNNKELRSFDNVNSYYVLHDPEGEVKNPTVWYPRRRSTLGLQISIKGF